MGIGVVFVIDLCFFCVCVIYNNLTYIPERYTCLVKVKYSVTYKWACATVGIVHVYTMVMYSHRRITYTYNVHRM